MKKIFSISIITALMVGVLGGFPVNAQEPLIMGDETYAITHEKNDASYAVTVLKESNDNYFIYVL